MKIIALKLSMIALVFWSCQESDMPKDNCSQVIINADQFIKRIFDPTTSIVEVSLQGSELELKVSYTGGCEEHSITMISDGAVAYSLPPQLWFVLDHDNQDPCDAVITEFFCYSLNELDSFVGEVMIHLEGWTESVHYKP